MPWRRPVHLGTDLDNTEKVLYTFGSNLVEGGAQIRKITIVNGSSGLQHVRIWLTDAGGTTSSSTRVYEEYVPANTTVYIDGPFCGNSLSVVKANGFVASPDVNVKLTLAEEYLQ